MSSAVPAQAAASATASAPREQMNIVIVGHVDHGKSTLVGRLLADTTSLPEGKLEAVRALCERQGKSFEYAFLLDALEAERDQGITIDSARVFFRTDHRDYIIIDAPGHIEFLKNMISGAARAEAAILLIDANEGVQENSRRHGYLLSMLGIRQVTVAVNKMDLVGYDQAVFDDIERTYRAFLAGCGVVPERFVPLSARMGDMVAERGDAMPWYDGPTVLQAVDMFRKAPPSERQALRMPVQDVYKFNFRGDDRRIIAGRLESGRVQVGDRVVFWPSGKASTVATLEGFNAPEQTFVEARRSAGLTLEEQIYVERGEILTHEDTPLRVSTLLRANLFWLGREPMRRGRWYKLKLATREARVRIKEILRVLDASELDSRLDKQEVGRHDVAELVLETRRPVAFDLTQEFEATGRFVVVDGYDVAGGGIILDALDDAHGDARREALQRDIAWIRGLVTRADREAREGHRAALVLVTGDAGVGKAALARHLERALFDQGARTYLLDGQNVRVGVEHDLREGEDGEELLRRFAEVAHLFVDAGHIVVSTTNAFGLADHQRIATLVPDTPLLIVHVGEEPSHDADLTATSDTAPAETTARILAQLAEMSILGGTKRADN